MGWNAPNAIVSATGFAFREDEDEFDLKMQFAAIVAANPAERLTAGYVLFKGPENYGRAMQAQAWLSDPVVQAEIGRILGPEFVQSILPSDDEVKKHAWDRANSVHDPRVALGYLELYAKMNGMLKDQGGGGNTYIQNVIQVPRRDESPEDRAVFQREFKDRQMKLVRDARSTRDD